MSGMLFSGLLEFLQDNFVLYFNFEYKGGQQNVPVNIFNVCKCLNRNVLLGLKNYGTNPTYNRRLSKCFMCTIY